MNETIFTPCGRKSADCIREHANLAWDDSLVIYSAGIRLSAFVVGKSEESRVYWREIARYHRKMVSCDHSSSLFEPANVLHIALISERTVFN